MNTFEPAQVGLVAKQVFESGHCCSESALVALAQMQGIASPAIPGIASGFCGGMARTGGTCGALTGAIMGLGLVFGSAKVASRPTQRLISEFEQQFGTRHCHVLIDFDPKGNDIDSAFNREGRRERCAVITSAAAELAARIILEQKE